MSPTTPPPFSSDSLVSSPASGPVIEPERISALDTARGLALLGILFVNIQVFGDAFGEFIKPVPDPGLANQIPYYFVTIFCTSKFYTLFSTLFGIGLAIQWTRAKEAGSSFTSRGLRRLLFLLALGACHALLLWYGDILFLYALMGLVLLPMLKWKPRTQATVGGVIMFVASLLTAGAMLLFAPDAKPNAPETTKAAAGATAEQPDAPEAKPDAKANPAIAVPPPPVSEQPSTAPEVAAATSAPSPDTVKESSSAFGEDDTGPFFDLIKGYESKKIEGGPEQPFWIEKEREAFREGPRLQSFLFNAMLWAMFLIFSILGFGWSVIAMFLFGAAIYKSGIVTAQPTHKLLRRLAFPGLLISLPLVALMAFLPRFVEAKWVHGVMGLIITPAAAAVALGYFGAIHAWVGSGKAPAIAKLFANVGRFGLTNYLMQTLICTTIFYHWGFGLFGETTRLERMGIVLAVYIFQLFLSALLVRVLAYGPIEWLWRTFTYLKPQPFLRR